MLFCGGGSKGGSADAVDFADCFFFDLFGFSDALADALADVDKDGN